MRAGIAHWKARGLDFSRLFAQPNVPADVPRFHVDVQDHNIEHTLDRKLIERSRPAIDKGERVQFIEVARNVNRSVGAMLSGEVTRVHPEGLPTTPSASSSKARAASRSAPSSRAASRST